MALFPLKHLIKKITDDIRAMNVRPVDDEGEKVSVATSEKQDEAKTVLDSLDNKDFATEDTLSNLESKDFATEGTLSSLESKDFSTETTLNDVKNLLDTIEGKDFATEEKLNQLYGKVDDLDGKIEAVKDDDAIRSQLTGSMVKLKGESYSSGSLTIGSGSVSTIYEMDGEDRFREVRVALRLFSSGDFQFRLRHQPNGGFGSDTFGEEWIDTSVGHDAFAVVTTHDRIDLRNIGESELDVREIEIVGVR